MHSFVPHTDSIPLNSNCAHTNLRNIAFKAFSFQILKAPQSTKSSQISLGLAIKQLSMPAQLTYYNTCTKIKKILEPLKTQNNILLLGFSFPFFIDKGKNRHYRTQQERITAAVIPKDCGTTE